jgi:hypothetical protein
MTNAGDEEEQRDDEVFHASMMPAILCHAYPPLLAMGIHTA